MSIKSKKEFIKVENGKFFSVSVGEGEPIIFIPGWLSIIDDLPLSSIFEAENLVFLSKYKLIYLHLSNFYKSSYSTRPYNLEDYANELKQIIDKMGFEKVSLVAHSAGGRFVLKFALMYPEMVEKIVLMSAAGLKSPQVTQDKLDRVRFYFAKFFANTKEKELLKETFSNVYNSDLTEDLNQIRAKTLILWGKKDTEMNVKKAHKFNELIKNSEVEIFPEFGHMIIREPKVYKRMFEFLES